MKAPAGIQRTPTITMKAGSEIVLADKALQEKIMAVVNAEPAKTKGAAMCSQMGAANLKRLRSPYDEGGCNILGPPGTPATGLGWDVSTEPKNKEDMIALAKKLNPSVGYWGEHQATPPDCVTSLLMEPPAPAERCEAGPLSPFRRPAQHRVRRCLA